MPISIAGSGTITGISAGGLPDDCITTADIAAGAVTDAKVNASAAIADTKLSGTTCKAWVNFNGTTATPSTIRASYNVSSVTKNGTGDYTVNFTTAMVDANYAIANGKDNALAGTFYGYWTTASQTTSNFRVNHTKIDSGSTYGDATTCMFSIFR